MFCVYIALIHTQVDLIKKLLLRQLSQARGSSSSRARALFAKKIVQVHTVDSFQGSEVDRVVLSFVRSNPGKQLGFLKDGRRLNVALTRAKYNLIMLGNYTTLCGKDRNRNKDVPALMAYIEKENARCTGHSLVVFFFFCALASSLLMAYIMRELFSN